VLGAHARSFAIGCFIVVMSIGRAATAQKVADPYEETITRARVLLPKQPEKVAVVDASRAVRAVDGYGRRVEAFAIRGENVVYLVAQGPTLRRARNGPGVFFEYVLATLIWHEMAHIGSPMRAKRSARKRNCGSSISLLGGSTRVAVCAI
jgi:hypothetical protein